MTARDTLSTLRIEDGRLWIDAATDWQLADAASVLGGDPPYHFLTRARGASKTSDLAAVALSLLLDADEPARLYWLGADQEQGGLAIDAIAGYVARTPALAAVVEVQSRQVLVPASGASLTILAADTAGAWGLRPSATFCDELANWPDNPGPRRLWEAVSSAVAKSASARLVVLTTAGDPAHFSREVLDHAYASPLWRVNEVPGPAPWADPERLAEQKARLTESGFARLFENRWVAAEDRLTSPEAVRECATLDGPQDYDRDHEPYVVAVDLGLKRDATVAAVCHREGSRIVLDRLGRWQGSRLRPVQIENVERWVEQASLSYGRAPIVLDPWQAVGLGQRLRGRGLRVEEFPFTAQSVGRLAATLYGLLRDRALALPRDDADLLDELAHVALRESSPGVFRMEKPGGGRSDDRAVALSLAAVELLREPEHRAPSSTKWHPWGKRPPVKLKPVHDGSREHEDWARWRYSQTGEKCPECLATFAQRAAAKKASRQAGPEPIRLGSKFQINPKGGRQI